MRRVLLFFVDGVGLGTEDAAVNPFVRARLPTLSDLLGGTATYSAAPRHGLRASLIPVDATLGFDGIPQSGTGQASLLTGHNAVALHGRHFGPWVPARLRTIVNDDSVLAQAMRAGHSAAFANAYPEEVKRLIDGEAAALPSDAPASDGSGRSRARRERKGPTFLRAGPPLAAIGAGLLTRHTRELERGDAVASELTNEGWRERLGRTNVPAIDAGTAGRNLARIAVQHDVTLFAHYSTDYAGHRQDMGAGVEALERLDAFLEGLLDQSGDDLLTFIVGDHGNIEDVRTGHTRNPALGIVIGRDHERISSRISALTDITPLIIEVLGARPG
jgi:2,3-bisphosphoglycerate-independent phosphoglycerate mutase